jgi:hypothetical protein
MLGAWGVGAKAGATRVITKCPQLNHIHKHAHRGLILAIHGMYERWQQRRMERVLQDGPEVGAHLPDAVERRPPHAYVRVDHARQHKLHDLPRSMCRQVLVRPQTASLHAKAMPTYAHTCCKCFFISL